jgi:hypothetical protein
MEDSMSTAPKFEVIEPTKTDTLQAEILPSVEATAIGLSRYQIVGRKGDLVVIVTQGKNPVSGKEEPAMVIANKRDPTHRHAFILLSQLYQVIVPEVMADVAPKLAKKLYSFVTREDLFRVADVLFEFAEDLQKAKPAQRLGTQQWLEALAQDGFTVRHKGQEVN